MFSMCAMDREALAGVERNERTMPGTVDNRKPAGAREERSKMPETVRKRGDAAESVDKREIAGANAENNGVVNKRETMQRTIYDKDLTVHIELSGSENVTTMELMKCVRELCGGLAACRCVGSRKYEITMTTAEGKRRLLEGFKIGTTSVMAKDINNDELVVSFLGLPAYITDEEILGKLQGWGVSATSTIRRRMWPGTNIADGTRYVKVKFNETVQSLPYSAKFNTASGPEHFRVIHDRQIKVCRICIQPGHILRECPEFCCHKCGVQGHFARECAKDMRRCELCHNNMNNCICNQSESEEENESEVESESRESGEESIEEEPADMEHDAELGECYAAQSISAERTASVRPVRAQSLNEALENTSGSLPNGQQQYKDEKKKAGSELKATDLSATTAQRDAAVARARAKTPSAISQEMPAVSLSADSDIDMDLSVISNLRKRQSSDRQPKMKKKKQNKKSGT